MTATMLLLIEQFLNGLQFGLLLFLLAAGLTLVFGIMDLVNLAHGSLYMLGAYFAATFTALTGSLPRRRRAGAGGDAAGRHGASRWSPCAGSTAATISTTCSAPSGSSCSSTSWCGWSGGRPA